MSDHGQNRYEFSQEATFEAVSLRISLLTSLTILIAIFWYCRFGFDFSDEGYYLAWISNPYLYAASATQFGFVYYPMYLLMEGNIAAVRAANALVTFGLGLLFLEAFFHRIDAFQRAGRSRLVLSAAFASATMFYLNDWLPTPNYNTLTFQGLLITATGALLADRVKGQRSLIGWLLIGAGGWVTFLAKPTSAAILGLATFVLLLFCRKISIRGALSALGLIGFLFLCTAFLIDGGVAAFILRLQNGVALSQILNKKYNLDFMMRLDLPEPEPIEWICFGVVFLALVLVSWRTYMRNVPSSGVLVSFSILIFTGTALLLGVQFIANYHVGKTQYIVMFAVPLVALGFGIFLRIESLMSYLKKSHLFVFLFLFSLPHIYAFGTGNDYSATGSKTGVFWIVSGLVFLAPVLSRYNTHRVVLVLALGTQVLVAVFIQSAIAKPYRQPEPLWQQNYLIDVGRSGSQLVVAKEFGRYLSQVQKVARDGGFENGTPFVDLSGQGPGVIYSLGSSNIGQPWSLGGYKHSWTFLVSILAYGSCDDLARAWVLDEKTGPRRISHGVLKSFGANFKTDYELVGSFSSAIGAGGYKATNEQQLYRPTRSKNMAIEACKKTRSGNK